MHFTSLHNKQLEEMKWDKNYCIVRTFECTVKHVHGLV